MSDNRASEGTPSPATPAPNLRELAEAVNQRTPGPWRTFTNRRYGPWANEDAEPLAGDGRPVLVRNWKEACLNAAYIVATQPAAILALLDELESTRSALREAQEAVEGWYADSVQAQYEVMFARFGDDADGDVRCGVANLSNANRIIRKVRAAAGSTT